MTKKLNIGMIGYGRMGQIHRHVLSGLEGVEVRAVYDPDAETARDGKLSVTVDEILSDPAIDAVYISTPNHVTAEISIAALKAGKHVFSEKPLGRSVKDARRVAQASADRPDQVFKVGFNHRYLAHYEEAKHFIREGTYGRLLWVRGRYGKGSDPAYGASWRADRERSGGGILFDQGIHMLDLMIDLTGPDFVEVQSMCAAQRWDKMNTEDNAFILLRNEAGQMLSMHASLTQYTHIFSMELGLENGLMEISGIHSSTRSYGKEQLRISHSWRNNVCKEEAITYATEDYYTIRAEDFIDCIRGKRQPEIGTIENAVHVMALIERIYENNTVFSKAS